MTKREKEIIAYINKELKRVNMDNMSVYAPTLTKIDCQRLQDTGKFTTVEREVMGYVKFERKVK